MKTHVIRYSPLLVDKDTRFEEWDDLMSTYAKNRALSAAKMRDIDAELNGGALVPVANILGKTLYMRVNHHDPERAKYELAEMRSLVKDVVFPEDLDLYNVDDEPREMTLEEASDYIGLSVVTLRRYIKAGRLPARKRGKNFIVTDKNLDKVTTTASSDLNQAEGSQNVTNNPS